MAQTPTTAGFVDQRVLTGLTNPTAVRFAPDGRIFVTEKSGLIKVFDSLTDTTPSIFADLRTNVHNYWDRGLLSLELDPGFPSRPYIYVLYTFDGPVGGPAPRWGTPGATSDSCPDPPGATTDGCEVTGRLSRLQASGNLMTGSERVLVHDWFQQFPGHSIGNLKFGPDGALYASGGEGASFQFVDYGQRGNPGGDPPVGAGGVQVPPHAEGGALRSQDLRTTQDPAGLSGTVIRIDPGTGSALPNNPGASSPDANVRRVVAYGFRNPFRFTFRPGTSELWVADVGWRSAEEINRIVNPLASPVRNFGWPCYEGSVRQSAYDAAELTLCETLYAAGGPLSSPHYEYFKGSPVVTGESCPFAGASITGIAFYAGGSYPTRYGGALFFADYTRRCIWVMFPGSDGVPNPATRTPFVTAAGYPVELQIGPGGDLFYVNFTGGAIHRIRYLDDVPPTAVATATPSSGLAPLTVQFDGSGSRDPDGGALRFEWDLDGNGAYGDSTAVKPTYTYSSSGTRTVRLRVTDPAGLTSVATVTVAVGNTPPTAVIDGPSASLRWRVGATIAFNGHAVDAQQGTLPASTLTWALVMNHCATSTTCHEHPIQTYVGVSSGSFVAPDHEYPSYLTLRLSARDSGGLEHSVIRRLDPETVNVRLESSPSGLVLGFGNDVVTTPATRTLLAGSATSLSAPSSQTLSGRQYTFVRWSDGGAPTHIVTPSAGTTYTATYQEAAGTLPPAWSSTRVATEGPAGTAAHTAGRFDVVGYGEDVWDTSDAFQYVHRSWTGDGEIVARVASLTLPSGASFAMAGVMFRESLSPAARHATVVFATNGKLKFRRRTAVGAATLSDGPSAGTLTGSQWIRLTRRGNVFTGYYSADGRTWTQAGPSTTLSLPSTILVGLVALRSGSTEPTVARFDPVDLSTSPLSAADVGAVGSAGSSTRDGGTTLLRGGGSDIWSTLDACHFEYRLWSGDGDITVRLQSLTSPTGSNWAMAGVMFRGSLAANSIHASLLFSTDGKLKFRRRITTGGTTASDGPSAGSTVVPRWLRLSRRAGTITAYQSVDGVKWTQVHVPQSITLPQTAYVGIWVLRNGGTGLGQARFSNLIIGTP